MVGLKQNQDVPFAESNPHQISDFCQPTDFTFIIETYLEIKPIMKLYSSGAISFPTMSQSPTDEIRNLYEKTSACFSTSSFIFSSTLSFF